jgi:hypothetical protein
MIRLHQEMDMPDVSAFSESSRTQQPLPFDGLAALAGSSHGVDRPTSAPTWHFLTEVGCVPSLVTIGRPADANEAEHLERLASLVASLLPAIRPRLRVFAYQPPGSPGANAWGGWQEAAFGDVETVYRPQSIWSRLLGAEPVPMLLRLRGFGWHAVSEPVRIELQSALRRHHSASPLHPPSAPAAPLDRQSLRP